MNAEDLSRFYSGTSTEQVRTRILLIEDDLADVLALRRFLSQNRHYPYELDHAESLADGIQCLEVADYHVILLDLGLPDTKGLDTLAAIRGHTRGVPVVVMTGNCDHNWAIAALRMGAQDYVFKQNLDPDGVWRAIRYAIQRAEAGRARDEAEQRFRLLFERSPVGILHCDEAGRIQLANDEACVLLGYDEMDLVGRDHGEFVRSDVARQALKRWAESDLVRFGPSEMEYCRADGGRVVAMTSAVRVTDTDGTARTWLTLENRSEQKKIEHRLVQLSLFDSLTGLANRRLFNHSLRESLGRAQRSRRPVALLVLDIDGFKDVNDTLGHAAGDALLKDIAGRLKSALRDGDIVARLGGDEFAVILENVTETGHAASVAEKLVRIIGEPCSLATGDARVAASVGIAMYPENSRDGKELAGMADAAMYRAKEKGGDGYCFYSSEINAGIERRAAIERASRTALENGELTLMFRPQLDLVTRRIVGLSAVAHWQHPELGAIDAAEYRPVLEATGRMRDFGRWILQESCRQLHRWQAGAGQRELMLSLNLATQQLGSVVIVDQVRDILSRTGIAPAALEVRVPESAFAGDSGRFVSHLRQLAELGIRICVDEFGSGANPVSYLRLLRVQGLRISESLVGDLATSHEARDIAQSVIALGRSLGLRCVARGVSSASEARALVEAGCFIGEGDYLHPVLPADAIGELLAEAAGTT